MKLVTDDKNQVFYWVDAEGNLLSPHFDYEEDADQWYLSLKENMNNESRGRQSSTQCA